MWHIHAESISNVISLIDKGKIDEARAELSKITSDGVTLGDI